MNRILFWIACAVAVTRGLRALVIEVRWLVLAIAALIVAIRLAAAAA
jgi:hypothetical protein